MMEVNENETKVLDLIQSFAVMTEGIRQAEEDASTPEAVQERLEKVDKVALHVLSRCAALHVLSRCAALHVLSRCDALHVLSRCAALHVLPWTRCLYSAFDTLASDGAWSG